MPANANGKGSDRRKGEDNKKIRDNWPKFKDGFVPFYKRKKEGDTDEINDSR